MDFDLSSIPSHIALIMDGNRRWAQQKGMEIIEGHIAGAEALTKIVKCASSLGVRYLTAYSFSTENWKRPEGEVASLMELFKIYLKKEKPTLLEEGVSFDMIGDISALPLDLQEVLYETKEETKKGTKLTLVLAINYGGRNEIIRAVRRLFVDWDEKKIEMEGFSESLFARYLDTHPFGDPDLLIRTSGEMRLSNFLLWQLSYAEILVTETLWPDFTEEKFLEMIQIYQKREKRIGR